jgi:type VI secretion system protein ImpA
MPEPGVIDLEVLLAPISEDAPAGEDLLYSGLHSEIKEARRSDDDMDQGDWKRELKTADWKAVVSLAKDALSNKTKDLQVAAWMTEALLHLHGLKGMRDGLLLLGGFLDKFWEGLYPEIEDGDLEARANCLSWLDKNVGPALGAIPITGCPDPNLNIGYLRWKWATTPDPPPTEKQRREDSEATQNWQQLKEEKERLQADYQKASSQTPMRFFETLETSLKECTDAFREVDRAIDERFGRQAPALLELKGALDNMTTLNAKVLKELRLSSPEAQEGGSEDYSGSGEGGPVASGGGGGGFGFSAGGAIASRHEALKRLSEIADYFKKTEPHSPVSFLVTRAVGWGNMPLDKWLRDVVKDEVVLASLHETLGIKSEESEE